MGGGFFFPLQILLRSSSFSLFCFLFLKGTRDWGGGGTAFVLCILILDTPLEARLFFFLPQFSVR